MLAEYLISTTEEKLVCNAIVLGECVVLDYDLHSQTLN